MRDFALRACGCTFAIRCDEDQTAELVEPLFARMAVPSSRAAAPAREYTIERAARGAFRVSDGGAPITLGDADRLLFHLDKDITLALQHLRPDLFFLHAAAVAWNGRVAVLAASPGTGKSTLALAALNDGFEYLSDELSPIDLTRLTVAPYPRALCLKAPPPPPYFLPQGTHVHGRRFHVPVAALPGPARIDDLPIGAFLFLRRLAPQDGVPVPMTPASAVAWLMANALNALAHPADGLDAAVALSGSIAAFELDISDSRLATTALRTILESAVQPTRDLA